jgi:hypothetical protein
MKGVKMDANGMAYVAIGGAGLFLLIYYLPGSQFRLVEVSSL